MTTPDLKERLTKERNNNLIGKIFVVVSAAFFVWAYGMVIAADWACSDNVVWKARPTF
jgi:hypothetical protein